MKKLFESKTKVNAIGALDAKIIFTKAPSLQYKQFLLDINFTQYLKTIMVSKKMLRIDVQKPPIRKPFTISTGSNRINIDFLGSNRRFDWLEISLVCDWLEISLVCDKSNKHATICDSYNVKLAAKRIKKCKARKFYRNLQPKK